MRVYLWFCGFSVYQILAESTDIRNFNGFPVFSENKMAAKTTFLSAILDYIPLVYNGFWGHSFIPNLNWIHQPRQFLKALMYFFENKMATETAILNQVLVKHPLVSSTSKYMCCVQILAQSIKKRGQYLKNEQRNTKTVKWNTRLK